MSPEIIDFICPNCGNDKSYAKITERSKFGECTRCHKMTYYERLKDIPITSSEPSVKCPYCGSLLTKKITKASKIGSLALWGVFALGKSTKEWHCNNCKSDF